MRNYKCGFTLLEVIVYVGILSFITTFVIGGVINISDRVVDVRVSRNLNRNAYVAMERILRDIRDSLAIDEGVVEPEYQGQVSEALALVNRNKEGQITTTKFFANEQGNLFVQVGDNAPKELLTSDVEVKDLSFTKLSTAHSNTIRVYLRVGDKQDRITDSKEHFGASVLRGSY